MRSGLRVLSLGGGVQASALLLMACSGLLDPLDAAVFADTDGEMPETYEHLDYLRAHAEQAGIGFLTVSAGDLRAELVARAGRGGQPNLAVRLRHSDQTLGRLNRYLWSYDLERRPITRAVKALCGPPGAQKRTSVEQWIGFSTDEIGRVNPAEECRCGHNRTRRATAGRSLTQIHTTQIHTTQIHTTQIHTAQIHTTDGCSRCRCTSFDPWQANRWPPVEHDLTRGDWRDWLARHGHPQPPLSACFFCPNRPASHWVYLSQHLPELWDQAVALDELLRHGINGLRGEAFLHPSGEPLARMAATPAAGPSAGDPTSNTVLDCEAGVCFT